jgi:methionyl-tRNA formyltransferase
MRLVFLGSGSFAVPVLRAVRRGGHNIALVVSQPPRRAGRGGKVRPTPVAEAAEQLSLPVATWPDINVPEALERISAAQPEVLVVVDFGQMIHAAVRELAPHQSFNLHASVLPTLRGAAPINWAILLGHEQTGVSTFRIVKSVDAGPLYLTETTDISPSETADDLRARLSGMGAELVCRTLDAIAAGAQPVAQDEARATKVGRLTKADGVIDWTQPAEQVRNRIHGCWSWPGGQAIFHRAEGDPVRVVIARCIDRPGQPGAEPGEVTTDMTIACGTGRVEILELKPSGKRLMTWQDFANGYRVAPGDRFVPPETSRG